MKGMSKGMKGSKEHKDMEKGGMKPMKPGMGKGGGKSSGKKMFGK